MRILTFASYVALVQLLWATGAAQLAAQAPDPPQVTETAFPLEGGSEMRYAISIPAGYDGAPENPRPLILALHPGGRSTYYGSWFMQSIVEPALRSWEAVIIAPDVPARNWSNSDSERAVLALVDHVLATHAIDDTRILITGFSMGGAGTWYLATRHADLFAGAIPMATRRGDNSLDGLGSTPVHLIHSPQDEVIPYDQAQETAQLLEARRHPVQLIRLTGAGHYLMGDYVRPLRTAGEWMLAQWEMGEASAPR